MLLELAMSPSRALLRVLLGTLTQRSLTQWSTNALFRAIRLYDYLLWFSLLLRPSFWLLLRRKGDAYDEVSHLLAIMLGDSSNSVRLVVILHEPEHAASEVTALATLMTLLLPLV